uniref:LYR motif-containing protein 4 isoform X1 n=1 Tax=Geotrypetes seraphini TaxID=260995 RepID=A0A6P8QE54_GEOSA|nr:LYR motif-containing protein 4 isoform X1 [Geotrypetes seraphini]XP_033785561.1 LYR motif-containing protein 4 isoform X1 [Geotrypetes seraphini]XP_033785562.1 LYR motif-containing protein 4 isoform X1 [Geotrypetes seraphini]XP_033785563.1 LYR motif-containing protein 4 isoform X1 [Geotrypetes seraphini]
MASSSRAHVLSLYRTMLRESKKFSSYNYRWLFVSFSRTYAIRRIRDAFKENKNVCNFQDIQTLLNRAEENLEIIQRQVTIGHLYSTQKLVIEHQEK